MIEATKHMLVRNRMDRHFLEQGGWPAQPFLRRLPVALAVTTTAAICFKRYATALIALRWSLFLFLLRVVFHITVRTGPL
jgi:hypothetical protein